MAKYRKRPLVIEATQWFRNGDHPEDDVMRVFEDTGRVPGAAREGAVVRYFRRPDFSGGKRCRKCDERFNDHGWIDTLEGGHIVCPGDFVVTGVHGEYYSVKPDIFAETYEAVVDG